MLQKRYLTISFSVVVLIMAFGVVWIFQKQQAHRGESPPVAKKKLTVAEFREKRQEFKEKYPAIDVWDNQNEADTVKMLNHVIENAAQRHGEDKSRDELLAHANWLLEKWGDPEKAAALRKEVDRILRETPEKMRRAEQVRQEAMETLEKSQALVKDAEAGLETSLAFFDEVMAEIAARRERLASGTHRETSLPETENRSRDPRSDHVEPPLIEDTAIEGPLSQAKNEAVNIPAFASDQWGQQFLSRVLDWNADFDEQYLDVVIAPHFSQAEFDEFFPTNAARQILHERQVEMHSEIAQRVQRALTEDTSNREEKLSIIRQTLSANWSPDLAESVLEQLR